MIKKLLTLIFGDIYLSLSNSFSFVSKLFFRVVFEYLVMISASLFTIKSLDACADFRIALFEAVLSGSVADFSARSRSF